MRNKEKQPFLTVGEMCVFAMLGALMFASKKLMDGHKGELFMLGLSFIGWEFLCVLTCGIGYLFLNPYMNAAHAAFYRNLVPAKVIDAAPVMDAEPTIIEP